MHSTFARAALILSTAISLAVAGDDPIVELGRDGITYRGTTTGSIEHFQNIRFAYDTSGDRRFAPPEPYVPSKGSSIDATSPGPACPQSTAAIPPFFAETSEISEDCLNLRISRPSGTTATDRLPVVVHIHGGGVVKGSAYDPHFDPDNLIALSVSLEKPIIYVALNYRLTIFGFARLPNLKDQKSLNVGMRDQRAGLQWVKDNIVQFGGDPDRVTIFGLSAGGTFSTLHPMTYGGEKGVPFSQIWTMSGPPGTALNMSGDATEMHTRAVAESLACGGDEREDDEVLKCLREVSMERLTEAAMAYSVANQPPLGLLTFVPSTDDDFIPDRQSALYKAGKFVKGIPTVFGWAEDDGAMNAGPAQFFANEDDVKNAIKRFTHALSDNDYENIFSLYPSSEFAEEVANYEAGKGKSDPEVSVHFFRASRILRDLLFTCSSIEFGYEMTRQSRALDPSFPGVRLYDLNQSMLSPMLKTAGMPYLGACHGSDTSYIFNGVFPEGEITDSDRELSVSMAGSFIHFAHTGNPTYPTFEDDYGFRKWPEAFSAIEGLNAEAGNPRLARLNVQVIGGPLGTGPCFLTDEEDGRAGPKVLDGMQMPLMGGMSMAEMEEAVFQARSAAVAKQRLLKRCALLSSLSEKLGV